MSKGPHKEPQKYANNRRKLTTLDENLIDRMPAFAALAQKYDYSPSEFLIRRRMEISDEEEACKESLSSGEYEALYQTGANNIPKRLRELQREGSALDVQMLAYEKPKLRSMEVSMTVEEKTVVDYIREMNERRDSKTK